jgi:hypothetical protein
MQLTITLGSDDWHPGWDEPISPPMLRLVGRSVRRARDGVILKSTTNSGGLL